MQLKIDMTGMSFMVAAAPNARVTFDTKVPKVTEDGRPLFTVSVLMMDGRESVPNRVSVAGDPGLFQGQFVKPVGLVLNAMERKGEGIQWWTAERLEPCAPPSFGQPAATTARGKQSE